MKVLVVGDGNFSFSLGYYCNNSSNSIVATSFDEYEQVVQKYPESKNILRKLKEGNVTLKFGVNACALSEYFSGEKFDKIIFNHPHLGIEDMHRHRMLLSHFLHACLGFLLEKGQVHVVLTNDQASRWELVERANSLGFYVENQFTFDDSLYPGYERRRHQNGKSFRRILLHGEHVDQISTQFAFQIGKLPNFNCIENARIVALPSIPCANCGKRFFTLQGLKTHVHNVHDGGPVCDQIKLYCKVCKNAVFYTKAALEQHVIAKHGIGHDIAPQVERNRQNECKIQCAICAFYFENDKNYNKHLDTVKPDTIQQIPCPNTACGRKYKDTRALHQHMNVCSYRHP